MIEANTNTGAQELLSKSIAKKNNPNVSRKISTIIPIIDLTSASYPFIREINSLALLPVSTLISLLPEGIILGRRVK